MASSGTLRSSRDDTIEVQQEYHQDHQRGLIDVHATQAQLDRATIGVVLPPIPAEDSDNVLSVYNAVMQKVLELPKVEQRALEPGDDRSLAGTHTKEVPIDVDITVRTALQALGHDKYLMERPDMSIHIHHSTICQTYSTRDKNEAISCGLFSQVCYGELWRREDRPGEWTPELDYIGKHNAERRWMIVKSMGEVHRQSYSLGKMLGMNPVDAQLLFNIGPDNNHKDKPARMTCSSKVRNFMAPFKQLVCYLINTYLEAKDKFLKTYDLVIRPYKKNGFEAAFDQIFKDANSLKHYIRDSDEMRLYTRDHRDLVRKVTSNRQRLFPPEIAILLYLLLCETRIASIDQHLTVADLRFTQGQVNQVQARLQLSWDGKAAGPRSAGKRKRSEAGNAEDDGSERDSSDQSKPRKKAKSKPATKPKKNATTPKSKNPAPIDKAQSGSLSRDNNSNNPVPASYSGIGGSNALFGPSSPVDADRASTPAPPHPSDGTLESGDGYFETAYVSDSEKDEAANDMASRHEDDGVLDAHSDIPSAYPVELQSDTNSKAAGTANSLGVVYQQTAGAIAPLGLSNMIAGDVVLVPHNKEQPSIDTRMDEAQHSDQEMHDAAEGEDEHVVVEDDASRDKITATSASGCSDSQTRARSQSLAEVHLAIDHLQQTLKVPENYLGLVRSATRNNCDHSSEEDAPPLSSGRPYIRASGSSNMTYTHLKGLYKSVADIYKETAVSACSAPGIYRLNVRHSTNIPTTSPRNNLLADYTTIWNSVTGTSIADTDTDYTSLLDMGYYSDWKMGAHSGTTTLQVLNYEDSTDRGHYTPSYMAVFYANTSELADTTRANVQFGVVGAKADMDHTIFESASLQCQILSAGESIFLPCGWVHKVMAITDLAMRYTESIDYDCMLASLRLFRHNLDTLHGDDLKNIVTDQQAKQWAQRLCSLSKYLKCQLDRDIRSGVKVGVFEQDRTSTPIEEYISASEQWLSIDKMDGLQVEAGQAMESPPAEMHRSNSLPPVPPIEPSEVPIEEKFGFEERTEHRDDSSAYVPPTETTEQGNSPYVTQPLAFTSSSHATTMVETMAPRDPPTATHDNPRPDSVESVPEQSSPLTLVLLGKTPASDDRGGDNILLPIIPPSSVPPVVNGDTDEQPNTKDLSNIETGSLPTDPPDESIVEDRPTENTQSTMELRPSSAILEDSGCAPRGGLDVIPPASERVAAPPTALQLGATTDVLHEPRMPEYTPAAIVANEQSVLTAHKDTPREPRHDPTVPTRLPDPPIALHLTTPPSSAVETSRLPHEDKGTATTAHTNATNNLLNSGPNTNQHNHLESRPTGNTQRQENNREQPEQVRGNSKPIPGRGPYAALEDEDDPKQGGSHNNNRSGQRQGNNSGGFSNQRAAPGHHHNDQRSRGNTHKNAYRGNNWNNRGSLPTSHPRSSHTQDRDYRSSPHTGFRGNHNSRDNTDVVPGPGLSEPNENALPFIQSQQRIDKRNAEKHEHRGVTYTQNDWLQGADLPAPAAFIDMPVEGGGVLRQSLTFVPPAQHLGKTARKTAKRRANEAAQANNVRR